MATSTHLFQSIQKYYQLLGIYPTLLNNKCSPNARNLMVLFCYVQYGISALAFFVMEAESVLEYGISFYTYISMLYCVYYFLILYKQMPKILQLIEQFEQFMDKSTLIVSHHKRIILNIDEYFSKLFVFLSMR